jgi:hypothetical protein
MNEYEYLEHREEFETFLLDNKEFFLDNNARYCVYPLLIQSYKTGEEPYHPTTRFIEIYDFINDNVDYSELCIYNKWSLGGTIGSWDGSAPFTIGKEKEPDFKQFDDVIKLIDPKDSSKFYKESIVIFDEKDCDWYGGCETHRFKLVNLYKLFVKVKGYK